jgi:hypothetical protein
MLDTMEIALFAGLGVLFAIGLAVLAHWSKIRPARLAAYGLVAVCFLYVGFAIRAENSETWLGFELSAGAFFGSLAGMTIIGSPWFVTAGLALHAAWTVYEHYFGAGQAFAPAPFVVATTAFDATVALYVAGVTLRAKFSKGQPAPVAPEPRLAARSQNRKGAAR